MRIIIYGAGGIGSAVGGNLALAGNDVVLIGRAGHVTAINKQGLRLITPAGTHVLQLPAVTNLSQLDFKPDDVVFLTVKGQDTENALRDLRSVNHEVPIFCFQNGVRNEDITARYFDRVYGVMVRLGATYLNDGEVYVHRDPPGWLVIGCYPRGTDELAEEVAKKLRSGGFLVKTSEDVMAYKWGKLMTNLGNAIGAITNTRADIDVIARAAHQELREALAQAGIKWVSASQLDKEWPEATLVRGSLDVDSKSSTWQSLTRRLGSVETEFLNGEVVRLAQKMGLQAPVNEGLLRICQEMAAKREMPGKYTPEQLCELLGLKRPAPGSHGS